MANRYPARLGGRWQFWALLLLPMALMLLASVWYARPARGDPGQQHSWFIWSGIVLALLFLAAFVFSLRKWSVKLRWVRHLGIEENAHPQTLSRRLREMESELDTGDGASPRKLLAEANRILKETNMAGVREAVIEYQATGRGLAKRPQLKIRRRERFGRMNKWLEVHVALGTVACIGAIVHADWVVRSVLGLCMAALSAIVLVTGVFGWWMTRAAPRLLVEQKLGMPIEVVGRVADHLRRCAEALLSLMEPEPRNHVAALVTGQPSAQTVAQVMKRVEGDETARDVLVLAGTRRALLKSAAPSFRIAFYLRLWRWIHIPSALLLLFLILIHIWTVIYF